MESHSRLGVEDDDDEAMPTQQITALVMTWQDGCEYDVASSNAWQGPRESTPMYCGVSVQFYEK